MERRLILQAIMLLVLPLIRLFGFVRSVNRTVIRRSYVLPSLLLICNDVSDRLLHEPRHYKSSTYYILTLHILSHHIYMLLTIFGGPFIDLSPSYKRIVEVNHPEEYHIHISIIVQSTQAPFAPGLCHRGS